MDQHPREVPGDRWRRARAWQAAKKGVDFWTVLAQKRGRGGMVGRHGDEFGGPPGGLVGECRSDIAGLLTSGLRSRLRHLRQVCIRSRQRRRHWTENPVPSPKIQVQF